MGGVILFTDFLSIEFLKETKGNIRSEVFKTSLKQYEQLTEFCILWCSDHPQENADRWLQTDYLSCVFKMSLHT
jgi:hypothetical protein